ncbi:hypothetical protein [Tessaracoccus sp.]
MSSARWAAMLPLVVSLLVVGGIRSAIPATLPSEYEVHADAQGVARTKEVTVQQISLETASSLRSAREFSDSEFTASPGTVLLVGRFTFVAHGNMFTVRSQIRTADGFTFEALPLNGFPQAPLVHVGMAVTTSLIYEVPEDKLDGVIGIHGVRPDGLQSVAALVAYPVPADLDMHPGEVTVPEDVVEPVR